MIETYIFLQLVGLWLFFSALVGVYAQYKDGDSAVGYFFISVFFSPAVGFIIAAITPSSAWRRCPLCAEPIKIKASVCRYCGRDLPPHEEVAVKTS